MKYDHTNQPAANGPESLKLKQGPGLNGLFLAAAPLSWKHDELSDTTAYVLNENFTLHMKGYPAKKPGIPPLKSETYKLLDILVYKLGENKTSCQVELLLEDFLRLAGYTISEANKNTVRSKLQENTALLGALSMDWTEKDGRYSYQGVGLFDEITYRNGRVNACFSETMALYLQNCPAMSLPCPLLAISGKSPHSYLLGRRCLVHNAVNKGREWQPIRVGNLLAACPRIPRPESGRKWSPSILERQVITPFATAMRILAASGILDWRFREPVCRSDYEGFVDSIVEFRLPDAVSAPSVEANTKCIWSRADTDWFLSQA